MKLKIYAKLLLTPLAVLLLVLSCEQFERPDYQSSEQSAAPARKPKAKLIIYKSENIVGYNNKKIIVDYAFLDEMKAINRHAKRFKLIVHVTSSFRPVGKTIQGAIVKPSRVSNHLAGHAIDMNIEHNGNWYDSKSMSRKQFHKLPQNVKGFLNAIRSEPGLRWGGDFKIEDTVHIDDYLNANYQDWLRVYKGCQKQYFDMIKSENG